MNVFTIDNCTKVIMAMPVGTTKDQIIDKMNELQEKELEKMEKDLIIEHNHSIEKMEKKRLTFDELEVGKCYFSQALRYHYLITSRYKNILRCKYWRSDNKWSDKKQQLTKEKVDGNFFNLSPKTATL